MLWKQGFSALQRAEIAEIIEFGKASERFYQVSVLFNEPKLLKLVWEQVRRTLRARFSALQRAEIAEIIACAITTAFPPWQVSVLFIEPKLLKWRK